MIKRLSMFLSVVTVIGLAAFAFSQPPGGRRPPGGGPGQPGEGGGFRPPPSPVLEALDANGDHEISSEEIKNAAAALMKLDKNEDGKLTPDEFRPHPPGDGGRRGRFGGGEEGRPRDRGRRDGEGGRGGEGGRRGEGRGGDGEPGGVAGDRPNPANELVSRLLDFDEDGDGKVTKKELPERMHSIIERHDANEDGALDKEEMAKMAEASARDRGGLGGNGGGRPEGGPPGPPNPERMVEHAFEFDADNDDKLSRKELRAFAEEIARHRPGRGGPGGPGAGPDGGPGGRPGRPARPESE